MENAEKRGLVFEHAIPTGAKKKKPKEAKFTGISAIALDFLSPVFETAHGNMA